MSIPKTLKKYLDSRKIKYAVIPHKKVFTAYDLAQTLGHELDKIAKTLLVKVELPQVKKKGKYVIVAVPASYRADLDKIKKTLKASKVEIAAERALKKVGIEPGALSPFANYHQLELIMDKTLLKARDVIVRAGSLTESIRMKVKDLHKLEGGTVGAFGSKVKGLKLQKRVKK